MSFSAREASQQPLLYRYCLSGHVKPTCSALLLTLAMTSSQPSRRRAMTSRDAEVDGPAVLSMSDLRLAQCYQFVEEVRPIPSATFHRANQDALP
jgi:hypothetical protein